MITKEDRIVAVYCGHASGPGWANSPLWVIVKDRNLDIREECLQPHEQTRDMGVLYNICSAVNAAMVQAVEAWREKYGKSK